MKISILRRNTLLSKLSARKQDKLIVDTIEAVCQLIMRDSTLKSVAEIKVRPLLRMKKSSTLGLCSSLGGGKYLIKIKVDLPPEVFISTLAHEVAHVNQFAEGRLNSHTGHFWWGNTLPKSYSFHNYTHEEYLNWPWEKEARAVEESYMLIFNSKNNKRRRL